MVFRVLREFIGTYLKKRAESHRKNCRDRDGFYFSRAKCIRIHLAEHFYSLMNSLVKIFLKTQHCCLNISIPICSGQNGFSHTITGMLSS